MACILRCFYFSHLKTNTFMANHFRNGFATHRHETAVAKLPVQGRIPDWLTGTLIRNTPAQYEVGSAAYRHWFDGLAMLHAFEINGSHVAYRNRFLRSKTFKAGTETGKIKYAEFATDPCRSLFKRIASAFSRPDLGGNCNVNVARFANEFVALTETPLALVFDPHTLDTLGVYDYDHTDAQISTAHPHFDRQQQIGISYAAKLGRTNEYRFYGLRGKQLNLLSAVEIGQPAYVHSFGITEHYLVLAECALKLPSALSLITSGKPFIENFEWLPAEGSRFLVVDKASGKVVAEALTEAFFAFHHVNAFERNGEVVVDVSAYPDAAIVDLLYLDELRKDGAGIPSGEFRRYRIPLGGGQARYELLSDDNIELPRLHYERCNGLPYRYAYGASIRPGAPDFFNQLTKFDVRTGRTETWHETQCYPGEPVFVPAPNQGAEDAGVVLSVVLDAPRATSFLLVLDAQSFAEMARVVVPHPVPFGFHGQFFADDPGTDA